MPASPCERNGEVVLQVPFPYRGKALYQKVMTMHDAPGNRTQFALGIGCRKGADPHVMAALAERVLEEAGIGGGRLAALATMDGKDAETAVIALAEALALPLLHFPADRLEKETPRLATPSDIVFRATGCHGVAEASALAALGPGARLVVPKRVLNGCTAAVAALS